MRKFLIVMSLTAVIVAIAVVSFASQENIGFAGTSDDEREAQRKEAVEQRDPTLLPLCIEKDFANRPTVPSHPPSLDPWENVGCRGVPDRVVSGAKSSTSLNHSTPNK